MTMRPSPFHLLFGFLFYTISQFCLWNISRYLTNDELMAFLLFPSGLRLAAGLLLPPTLSWIFLLSDLILAAMLALLLPTLSYTPLMILFPCLSFALTQAIWQHYWLNIRFYWQKLLLILTLVGLNTVIITLVFLLMMKPLEIPAPALISAAIVSLTGGVILAPFLYLLSDYLQHQTWQPLNPALIHQEIRLRPSVLLWSLLFFSLGLIAELTLMEQMKPLALLIIMLPNIFLAYRYGWQGGVLASALNSILLAAARQITGSFASDQELLIFMASQALVGLGLGIAISRQHRLFEELRQLNHRLAKELADKQTLTRQLISIEEEIRKSVARELHDEIGQNITAIQIQAMLAERVAESQQARQAASAIHTIAMRVHQATRSLLKQLRPSTLDELGLEHAIRQLMQEMRFKERGTDIQFSLGMSPQRLDDITKVTLFRIIQELLNNIAKHAQASQIQICLFPGSDLTLEVRDNGTGLPRDWKLRGHGLKGIAERVSALGGKLAIQPLSPQGKGTRVIVNLPTKITGSGKK